MASIRDIVRPSIVFFDAWHTLFTVSGHGPERLAHAMRVHGLPVDATEIPQASRRARLRLADLALPFVRTPEDEQRWLTTLTRLTLDELGVAGAADLAESVARAADYVPYCRLYADVRPTLDALHARGYRLGLLSNAFPSLIVALDRLGVLSDFDPQVLSAFEGVEKPAPAIYHAALRAAAVSAAATLFIDDQPDNIAAAESIGMRGVLLDRDQSHAALPYIRVRLLTDLLALLEE